jgi:hypothetical protein
VLLEVGVMEREKKLMPRHDHLELIAAVAARGAQQLLIPTGTAGHVPYDEHRIALHGSLRSMALVTDFDAYL